MNNKFFLSGPHQKMRFYIILTENEAISIFLGAEYLVFHVTGSIVKNGFGR